MIPSTKGRGGGEGGEEEGEEEEGERYWDLNPSILGCSKDWILASRMEIESSLSLRSDSREVILVCASATSWLRYSM